MVPIMHIENDQLTNGLCQRLLRRSGHRVPGLPRLHRRRQRWPPQELLPLPQRHHLQPELLHLRLVVQLRLLRSCWSVDLLPELLSYLDL